MTEVRCFACGAPVQDIDGPTHGYMSSAPGCWALYTALQDWTLGLAGEDRLTLAMDLVDTYAAQHATNTERRNRQSVAVHLMSLCLTLEHGVSGARRRMLIGGWTHREYPALTPRPGAYPLTVRDLADAPEADRAALVREMAAATWAAWTPHHAAIRAWLAPR